MVVYLDMAFLLNALADAAALAAAGRLSGLPLNGLRLLSASLLGGTYGALCALPGWKFLAAFPCRIILAAVLVGLVCGWRDAFIRRLLLFYLLSCSLAGAVMAFWRLLQEHQGLASLNWKAFFLAGGGCFLLLSIVFRGGARHGVSGQLRRCEIVRNGRTARLTALLDTGATLTDGFSGDPVLTVHWSALDGLWTPEERQILSRLESDGAAACLERLGCGFRLLPYQAVGVRHGMLLCFRAEGASINGRPVGPVTVALSPTPVSDGGGYAALWGGPDDGKEGAYAA